MRRRCPSEAGVQYVNTITGGADRFSVNGRLWGMVQGAGTFAFVDPSSGEVRFEVDSFVNGGAQVHGRAVDLPPGPEQSLKNLALYAHDTWSIGKWRIDAGLRWERYEGDKALAGANVDVSALAPRLAVTHDIRRNWQVQGFYGEYVGRLEDRILSGLTGVGSRPFIAQVYIGPSLTDQSQQDLEAILFDDSQWGPVIDVLNPEVPTQFTSEDLELPRARDVTLSMRWGLPRGTGHVTLALTDREYLDAIEGFIGGFGTTDVPAPGTGGSLPADNRIWGNTPQSDRQYQAVTVTWDYRPGAVWDLGGNYTYSEATGNYERTDSTIGDYVLARPDEFAVPRGTLLVDIPHRLNLWGNYRLDFDRAGALTLGAMARFQSGTPWSRTAFVSYEDVPEYVNEVNFGYDHYFDGRGNNRFDDWWTLDLSARHAIELGRGVDAWIRASVVNVLNEDALITFDTTANAVTGPGGELVWQPAPTFGQALNQRYYQVPRSWLFSVGVTF